MNVVDVKQFVTLPDGTRAYAWKTMKVTEAMRLAEPKLRCPECKGAVGLFCASDNGRMPNRAEHRKRNRGCSLGDCFEGTHQLATNPIDENEKSLP